MGLLQQVGQGLLQPGLVRQHRLGRQLSLQAKRDVRGEAGDQILPAARFQARRRPLGEARIAEDKKSPGGACACINDAMTVEPGRPATPPAPGAPCRPPRRSTIASPTRRGPAAARERGPGQLRPRRPDLERSVAGTLAGQCVGRGQHRRPPGAVPAPALRPGRASAPRWRLAYACRRPRRRGSWRPGKPCARCARRMRALER